MSPCGYLWESWKVFVGHHRSHSARVSEVMLCAMRDCSFCRKRKVLTNKESQKKCLKYENRLPKASVFVICSLLNIISCNYCKPCKTASGEFRHICDIYIIMIIKHPSGYTHDNAVLLSYVSISFLIYIFSVTCDVLLKIPNLFSCTSFKFLLLGRDCYFFSLTLGHSNYLFIFT